jgi:sirohydrochlorin ferrochelatase
MATAPDPRTAVVLAAAGSAGPAANATIRGIAASWQLTRGWHSVVPAYASAAAPTVGEAVRALRETTGVRRVVVSTYLLAPGFFADRIRVQALAAGADLVAPALGALPEIADIVLERYMVTAGDICLRSA